MKNHRFALVVFLFLFVIASTASAKGAESPEPPAPHQDYGAPLDTDHFFRSSQCPDIAHTPAFKTGGLGYVHSLEFAESAHAVANGKSPYSPEAIPSVWRATAYNWWTHVVANEVVRVEFPSKKEDSLGLSQPFLRTPTGMVLDRERHRLKEDSCDPQLLYLASLEYRRRTGQQEANPVLPKTTRKATVDLASSLIDRLEIAKQFAWNVDAMDAKLAKAEQLGAYVCQPTELDRVRTNIILTRQKIIDTHQDVGVAELSLAMVGKDADDILKRQMYASQRGILCYSR